MKQFSKCLNVVNPVV
uniref:Uncharacterized protein n=1 Tax=Arundo donax TaxID=35708 RepID=A0A0A8YW64_ARUDO